MTEQIIQSLLIALIGGMGTWIASEVRKAIKDVNSAWARIRTLEQSIRIMSDKLEQIDGNARNRKKA